MAITDLTGTTWTFNDTVDFSLILQSKRFNINATTSFGEATSIYINQDNISFYLPTYGTDVQFYNNSGWFDSNAKTIIISGGTDATNLTLISFIESNATKNITDLTGTTWVFNNTLLASPYTGYTKTIHVDITCNNVSYDTMLLMFSYGLEPSIVTSVYVQNEGESGSVIQIYNDSTGSVDDGWVNDNYKTITFTGGEDIADSDFVSWVQQNASIKVYDVVVTYNNSVSICLDDTGTAILDTEGTYLTDDITIEYTRPSGSSIIVSPLSVTSNGTYTASSGTAYSPVTVNVSGGTDTVVDFIENHDTYSSFVNSSVTKIAPYTFYGCSSLKTVDFQACSIIGSSAFLNCKSLITISFPECTQVNYGAFYGCSSLSSASLSKCTIIRSSAFYSCKKLSTIYAPMCSNIQSSAFYGAGLTYADFPSVSTTIGAAAFAYCSSMETISFPECPSTAASAFGSCYKLKSVELPKCKYFAGNVFNNCSSLSVVSLPMMSVMTGSTNFYRCYHLVSLYLLGSSVAKLSNSNTFTSTPIAGYTTSTGGVYGSIYVPSSLYSSYISATNWTYFSSRFVSV